MKKLFIDGKWVDTGQTIDVTRPYDGSLVDTICSASIEQTEAAIEAAFKAKDVMKKN